MRPTAALSGEPICGACMSLLFWCCLVTAAYAYFGYPVFLSLLPRRPFRSDGAAAAAPTVSVIIAARNEAANLPRKLENLGRLDYPADRLQIVIASDASTDETAEFLLTHASALTPVILTQSAGKAGALNAAVAAATGEFLVFLDARQTVEPEAITELLRPFSDPSVGAISGELLLDQDPGSNAPEGLGIYWKIEKLIRRLESRTGSVVGVTGAIYALRRSLYKDVPAFTLLDDVYIPMQAARAGYRVIFQPSAIARDRLFVEKGKEFSRKVRTLTGNYQLLRTAPWLLSGANPLLFRFISHKLLRLTVPFLLVIMLLASAMAHGMLYQTIFAAQLLFYILAGYGLAFEKARALKPIAIASTFVMLNTAAAMAFYNFVAGRDRVWVR